MFARSTKRIIHWLCRKKIIKQQDMDVYAYGIQNLLIFLFNLFSFMVIGAIFHTIMYTVVFILFYSVLRIYAGGYHASTAMRCYFISNVIVLMFIILQILKINTQTNQKRNVMERELELFCLQNCQYSSSRFGLDDKSFQLQLCFHFVQCVS